MASNDIKNRSSVTYSRTSEDRSGYSLKYEAYDPNQEPNIPSKVASSNSYNKWGHLNFSKETTSKNTIEEGSSVINSQNVIKKSLEDDKNCKMVVYTSNNRSPSSAVDYDTPNVEK
jgi:hypothetical protein